MPEDRPTTVDDNGVDASSELRRLRLENARLKALLTRNGIALGEVGGGATCVGTAARASGFPDMATLASFQALSLPEKVTLFRSLFRGRDDVYAVRWESGDKRSGYSPVCANEWNPVHCRKPQIKCGDCSARALRPLTDKVVYDHLDGKHTVGVYPILPDDTCWFLAADFDDADWRQDALAFVQTCRHYEVPVALEISRSGTGAHVWMFFGGPVPARTARHLGAALISRTCDRSRLLKLSSYDRLFPNQDTLPKGGFGNLIALPLQKVPRAAGHSVFVDDLFEPFPDQWSFLSSIRRLDPAEMDEVLGRVGAGRHPLDIAYVSDIDETAPWKPRKRNNCKLEGPLPESVGIVVANQVFIERAGLPQVLSNRLMRLAAFQNPEFRRAQAMRMPVWNKPQVICCADMHQQHIALPRGCLDAVSGLLGRNGIQVRRQDLRTAGQQLAVQFQGTLRDDQQEAVEAMLRHDIGVLCAPTAFGKTVVAAALIARRAVSTLVLVHRAELLRQWQERLTAFLDLPCGVPGLIGGGRERLSRVVDIAVMQSLIRRDDLPDLLGRYGQIIVDECHHISAFSFESVLKMATARYVMGLTATPERRDGHHPIIFMQCGPIRHKSARPSAAPSALEVRPRFLNAPKMPPEDSIQEVFRTLAEDASRNGRILRDIEDLYRAGRKILVLTERTEHLDVLSRAVAERIGPPFALRGSQSSKQRKAVMDSLELLDDSAPRILMSTGRLIGEGFDHAPLDTLVLAMPISWKGTLQQYVGRLHRVHQGKQDLRVYDYVEADHPQLARMWAKRRAGYRAMGYVERIEGEPVEGCLDFGQPGEL